jgi:hypothetical protein
MWALPLLQNIDAVRPLGIRTPVYGLYVSPKTGLAHSAENPLGLAFQMVIDLIRQFISILYLKN